MTGKASLSAAGRSVGRFRADESGANLVEFALVVTLFLFLLLGLIDFGRVGHAWVSANKATQIAVRLAAVRPPACAGVPLLNVRGTAASPPAYGTLCRAGANVCLETDEYGEPLEFRCPGDATNATALEIFTAVRPLIPADTTIGKMRYRYTFDRDLGFLGGPFVPMVTVEFTGVRFIFVSQQLGAFVTALTGRSSTLGTELPMPGMSASLPGEDLASGTDG